MTDDWTPNAIRDERAEPRAAVRDMAYSRALNGSALQVDDNVQQVRAGLEGLGVGGEATLRLDHRRQFVGKIDVRILKCSGSNGTQSTHTGRSDLQVSGVQAHRIDVTDFGFEI